MIFKMFFFLLCSQGSVINTMNVNFESTSVPNNTEIASVMVSAASNVTGFDIEGSSIIVDDTRKLHWLLLDQIFQKLLRHLWK